MYGEGPQELPQPVENQIEICAAFVQEHKANLGLVENAFGENIGKIWTTGKGVVGVNLQPPEVVLVRDIVSTGTELFDKIITVFGVLCDEINELKVIAETRFYPASFVYSSSCRRERATGLRCRP